MSIYILLNSLVYVISWNLLIFLTYGKYSLTALLISIVAFFLPAALVGMLSDDGNIEHLFKRSLRSYAREKLFIIFSILSAMPCSLLVLYFGIKAQPNLGTLISGVSLCVNAMLVAFVQFIIFMKLNKSEGEKKGSGRKRGRTFKINILIL